MAIIEQGGLSHLNNHLRLISPIIKRIKEEHRGQDWQGSEPCPVCDNTLHLSHSKLKAHVAGKCETKNCLKWAQ